MYYYSRLARKEVVRVVTHDGMLREMAVEDPRIRVSREMAVDRLCSHVGSAEAVVPVKEMARRIPELVMPILHVHSLVPHPRPCPFTPAELCVAHRRSTAYRCV